MIKFWARLNSVDRQTDRCKTVSPWLFHPGVAVCGHKKHRIYDFEGGFSQEKQDGHTELQTLPNISQGDYFINLTVQWS